MRSRLLLLIAAAVLPLAGLSVWSALQEADDASRRTQGQLLLTADVLATHFEAVSGSAEHLLTAISAMPQVREQDREACNAYFGAMRGRLPVYANIGLLGADGQIVCHASARQGSFNASDRDYFLAAVRDRRFAVGTPAVGRASGNRILPFALPLEQSGAVRGVAFAALDLQHSDAILGQMDLPSGVRLTLANQRGSVLATEPPRPDTPALPNAQIQAAAAMLTRGTGVLVTPDGMERLYAHAPTRRIGEAGFIAVASLDRTSVTGPAYRRMWQELLLMAALATAGFLAAWAVGARMLVRPARQLLDAAHRMEKGQLDARVPSSGSRSEFAGIANAFNRMAQSLQSRQQEVQDELGKSRRAKAVLEAVLDSMREGLAAADGQGRFLLHNRAALALFDLEGGSPGPQEWPARFGLFRPDRQTHCDYAELPLMRALRGETGQMLLWVRNSRAPAGKMLLFSYMPLLQEQAGLTVFTDVTELQRLQDEQASLARVLTALNESLEHRVQERTQELSRQEARFRALAEQAPAIVWNTDVRGQLTYVNRAWTDLVGGRAEDWLGTRWLERVHPDDVEPMTRAWVDARRAVSTYVGTRRIRASDGTWHTMAYRAAPVLDATSQVEFWVGIDADVTEFKAVEAALREANREIEIFSYAVSHDLRSPLAAMDGFSAALGRRLEPIQDPQVAHYLDRIRRAALRMDHLIDAMLSLARLASQPVEPADVDLSILAQDILDGLREAQPDRQVESHVEAGLAARGDVRLLRAMLENLLGNAWKFTGGRSPALIHVGTAVVDGHPAFYVRDNGAGFDMAHADRLFRPFMRLHGDTEFPGTGIGLATVQRVVVRHQGRVWAQAAEGQGTTIWFTLPGAAGS